MSRFNFHVLISSFLLFASVISAFDDCTSLSRECCWRPANDSTAWQKHESIDEGWYRRVFRSRVVRPPPAQSYYSSILTNPGDHSSLESCSYCSRTGNIKLWIRHWTTSSAQVRFCWRQKSGLRDLTECRDFDSSRSGLIDSEQLSVQRNLPVFFSIQLHALNSTPWTIPPAALIDFLNVRSELCSLNIQKLKSTRFVLLGGSHLNKPTSKATTTTLLPLLAPSQPSQSIVDAFFNEDDPVETTTMAESKFEEVTSLASGLDLGKLPTVQAGPLKSSVPEVFNSASSNKYEHVKSPTTMFNLPRLSPSVSSHPGSFQPKSNLPPPLQQEAAPWKPASTPWMSARDIDFLVPKVLVPRGNEWSVQEAQPEERDPPKPAFAVNAPAPLSFSNMLGWPQPTQLPTIDVTNPAIRGGLQVKKLPGSHDAGRRDFDERQLSRGFEGRRPDQFGRELIGIYNGPKLPESSGNLNVHGTSEFLSLPNPSSKQLNVHGTNKFSRLPGSNFPSNLPGPTSTSNVPEPFGTPILPDPALNPRLFSTPNLPGPLEIPTLPSNQVGSINSPNPTFASNLFAPSNLPAPFLNPTLPDPTIQTNFGIPTFNPALPTLPAPIIDQSIDQRPSVQPTQWAKEELAAFKKTAYRPKPFEFATTVTQPPLHSTLPPKLFNPFADLFGEEFADFLDPAFNTSKYDEMELRHEQQKEVLPIRQLNSKTLKSAHGKLVTAQQMDGDSKQLQHKMSRMEKIGNDGPEPYRLRHTTSNPLKLKPPPLLAVHARVFSTPTAPSPSSTTKNEDRQRGSSNSTQKEDRRGSTNLSQKEGKNEANPKFKATNYSEAKFTRLSWEEFQQLKKKEGKKANASHVDLPDLSHRSSPWSTKKPKKECNYTGGCLFERSSCNFTNSKTLSSNSQFRRVSVGSSNFVESRVSSGDVAVFESRVNASSGKSFYLLFDYLEWTEGEKLSACCHTPGRQPIELYCPFESSTNETDIRWQSEKIRCEPETSRILFICENFGRRSGICALDNVRLHAEWDREFKEPCQGEQLALI